MEYSKDQTPFPQSAQEKINAGDFDGALAESEPFSMHESREMRIASFLLCGHIYFKKGHPIKALPFFQKAVEEDPRNADSWHAFGVAAENAGAAAQAMISFEQALRLNPKHAHSKNRLTALRSRTTASVRRLATQILNNEEVDDPSCGEVRYFSGDSIRFLRLAMLCEKLRGEYRPFLLGIITAPSEWLRMPRFWEVFGVLFKKNFYRFLLVISVLAIFMNFYILSLWLPFDGFQDVRLSENVQFENAILPGEITDVNSWPVVPDESFRPDAMSQFRWLFEKYLIWPSVTLSAKVLTLLGPWVALIGVFFSLFAGDSFNVILFFWGIFSNFIFSIIFLMFGYLGFCFMATFVRFIDLATQKYRFADNRLYLWTGFLSRKMSAIELHRMVGIETHNVGIHRLFDYGKIEIQYKNNIESSKTVTLYSIHNNSSDMFNRTDSFLNLVFELREIVRDGPR